MEAVDTLNTMITAFAENVVMKTEEESKRSELKMPKIKRTAPLGLNETYVKQCELSPVQRRWNPRGEDLVVEEVMDFDIISYNKDKPLP